MITKSQKRFSSVAGLQQDIKPSLAEKRARSLSSGIPVNSKKRTNTRSTLSLLLMMLPGLLLLLVFNYIPLVGLVIAFEDFHPYEGIFGSAWVGLQNFAYLFQTSIAINATRNTVGLNTIFIVTILIAALAIAVALHEIRDKVPWLGKIYQSVLFLPYFISYVLVGYFIFALLNADNGLVNHVASSLHMPRVNWYATPQYWPVILTIVNLWKNVGFWSIVYYAGILGINPEYYEAARMDGANRWQQFRAVTLPLLSPLIIINILLSIGRIFYADFGLFYQATLNNPLLYSTTDVIDTFVYRSLTSLGDVGMAAAASFYQAVIGFLLVLVSNWIVRRIDPEKAIF
jgi:putative aldouronate transport system permease protein